jgi:hypothetical protein
MAESVEDKGLLSQKLEEDREKIGVQTAELKEEYDVLHRINAAVQKNPLPWVMAALLVGFLLSRLPPAAKKFLFGMNLFSERHPEKSRYHRLVRTMMSFPK